MDVRCGADLRFCRRFIVLSSILGGGGRTGAVVNLSTTVTRVEGPSSESESKLSFSQVFVIFVVRSWLEIYLIEMWRVGDRLIVLEVGRLCIGG